MKYLAALLLFLPVAAYADMAEPPAPAGTVAYNEWLGRTFSEVLLNEEDQAKRIEILERIVALDYIQHNPLVPEGRQGLIDFLPVIWASFPDAEFILHDVFATEDRVVTQWTWTGTLSGKPFLGFAPEGQRVEFDAIDVWSVRDGMLHEHWDQFDWPRALIQLGQDGFPPPFVDVANAPADR